MGDFLDSRGENSSIRHKINALVIPPPGSVGCFEITPAFRAGLFMLNIYRDCEWLSIPIEIEFE